MFNIYKISYQMDLLNTKEVGGSLNLESVGEGKRTLRSDKKYIDTAEDSNILEHINASIFRHTKC